MKCICKYCGSQIPSWAKPQLWYVITNEYHYRCNQCAYKCDRCSVNPAIISYNVTYKLNGFVFDKKVYRCGEHQTLDYEDMETLYKPDGKVWISTEIVLITVIAKVVTHEEEQVYSVMAE